MAERPIDEKIVVMKLDNSDFQQKAAETTSIFGKIREALSKIPSINLGKTVQDLSSINQAVNTTSVNSLANSVDALASRFSHLRVIATTTLATITNHAVNAGLQMTKSLTFDQVSSGFREYETKIGAIGTMLANTEWAGSTLDDVKKTLGELNDYADNTIYSFEQMTQNVGRFTAAGVTLEDSAIAIKGLGNLAAISGSDVNQLNTAMYQSSQALASGKLNLEDWNSLVNAGMAGKKTQDALVKTAKAMGKNVDLTDGFRNSIQDGWLTSEVFLATLKKFGEDESMTKAATSVRTFTGMLGALKEGIGSGWAATFEHIFGDFEEATEFWTNASNAIGGWFSKTAAARNKLFAGIANKGGFQNIFSGIANATKPLGQVFKSIGDGFRKVFPAKSVNQIVKMTESFKQFTAGLKLSSGTVSKLTTIFQGVFSVFSTVFEIVKQLGSAFLNLIPDGAGGGTLDLLEKIAQLHIAFNKSVKEGNILTATISGLGKIFSVIGEAVGITSGLFSDFGGSIMSNLGTALDWLTDKLKVAGKFLKEAFSGVGGDDLLGAGTLVGIVTIVGTTIGKIWGLFDNFGDIAENFGETLEGVKDAVQNFAMGIKIANLLLIAIALGILAASLKTLEGIKTEDITKGITSLAVALAIMIGGMMVMDKFNVTGGLRASLTLIALAAAINIMASSLKKVSDLNPEELKRGLGSLVAITAALAGAIIAMSKWGGKIGTSSLSLIALAGAVYILASAVDKMSSIKPGKLFTAMGALALIFAQIAIFLKVVNGSKLGVGSALGILITAAAIQVMVGAVNKLGNLNIKQLAKGLTSIAVLLAQIVLFSRLSGGPQMLAAGVGLLIISVAMNALIVPIEKLGKMSMAQLAKGLISMALALAAVTAAGILATGAIGGAVAITLMAAALNLLVIPIEKMGKMSLWELVKGFGGLAIGMTLLALAATLLTPAVPSMLAFGAGLLVIGAAVALAGAGIALFGLGLATLATMTATSIAAIVASLALLLKGLADLIPGVVNFIVQLGLALIQGIVALAIPLANGVVKLIVGLLTVITTYLPRFIELGTKLIVQLLEGMGQAIPTVVDAVVNFMIQIIDGMASAIENNGTRLTSAIMNLMGEILIVVIDAGIQMMTAIYGWIPGVSEAAASVGSTAEQYIRDNFGAKEVGSEKGTEFAGGLSGKSGAAGSAGQNVGNSAKSGAAGVGLLATGTAKGQEFVSGIASKAGAAGSSGTGLGNAAKGGAESVSATSAGTNFGQGFVNGIGGMVDRAASVARSLASAAANAIESFLDINSPSRLMRKDGGYFGEGFALGIGDKVKAVASNAKGLAVTAKDSLNQFLDGFELPEDDNELHFKAVVDYDRLDVNRFGTLSPMTLRPDMSLTNGLITATKSQIRQNNYKPPTVKVAKASIIPTDNNNKQPIIIQSVLNGRVLAEEIIEDVSTLQNKQRLAIDRARGEY